MHKFLKILFILLLVISLDVTSQENNLHRFTTSDGLSTNFINDVAQDENGYLWIATNKGYTKFDGVNFTNYKQEKANCIFIEKDKVYIGFKNGLLILQNNKSFFFESKEILKIRSINNKITLATTQGICMLKEDYILPLQIHTKVDFSLINDIFFLKNTIYIAAINGLWSLDKLYKPKEVHKISNENYVSFLENNGQIIASTKNNGLKIVYDDAIIKNIVTSENNTSIKKIDNELWVSSKENGIEILDKNNYSFKRRINKYNSKLSNKINSVYKDNEGTIWLASSDRGLYKYNSNKKISIPKIFIENILVNYKKLDFLNLKKLILKPDENTISFTFKTINLKNQKHIKYRYSLNNEFTSWSRQNKVDFSHLKAGKYTFIVQSKNKKNLSKKVAFNFFIETPIYKKTWFLILCVAILCFVFAGIVDLYIRKLNKKNQQKIDTLKTANHLLTLEQKALQLQMNPHFIFNVLNGIKALGNSGNPKELNKTISQFSILLRSVLNNSRLEEISLKDEIETLKNYLDLEQKMNPKSFEYTIEKSLKNIDSEEILIPPMLIQPFIENCIKHAFSPNTENAKIEVFFKVENNFLHFIIKDNGIGFLQSKKEKVHTNHKSVALEVTKERIQNLTKYNSFSIEEIKDKLNIMGTKVSFKIPLKTDY